MPHIDDELHNVAIEEADAEDFNKELILANAVEQQQQKYGSSAHNMSRGSKRYQDLIFEDMDSGITYGRRIQRVLSQYAWYYPRTADLKGQKQKGGDWETSSEHVATGTGAGAGTDADADETRMSTRTKKRSELEKYNGLNLDSAWAYFEHIALPRKIAAVHADRIANLDSVKAQAGDTDHETELYPVWSTPEKRLGDFGAGIGVYFATMRYLTVMCALCALFYLPTILYYAGSDYDDTENDYSSISLQGSAICLNTRWVPCEGCDESKFDVTRFRRQTIDGVEYTFAKKNLCEGGITGLGVNHLLVLGFVVATVLFMGLYQARTEDNMDALTLTSSDYSIKISDPPADATDPEGMQWNLKHCLIVCDSFILLTN